MKFITALLVLAFIFLQYKLWCEPNGVKEMLTLRHQISEQNQQNDLLANRNSALQAEVDDLKTGHEAIEERARNELGMIRQGETFYQIVRPEDQKSS